MTLVFDVYDGDEFVTGIEHEVSNHKHMIDYLIGFTNNSNYVIKNMRVWG